MSFFSDEPAKSGLAQIVNVASVPKRSPFRYPGGKTWLVPHIRDWLGSLSHRPDLLVEPFAGGGIVALTVAFEQLADHVIMDEEHASCRDDGIVDWTQLDLGAAVAL